jgi:hypothetical protein
VLWYVVDHCVSRYTFTVVHINFFVRCTSIKQTSFQRIIVDTCAIMDNLSSLSQHMLSRQPNFLQGDARPKGIRICQDVIAEEYADEYVSLFRKLKAVVEKQGDQVRRDGVLSITIAEDAVLSSPLTRTVTIVTVFASKEQMEAARTGSGYHAFESLVGRPGVLHSTLQRELVEIN